MEIAGYDPQRFMGTDHKQFICMICRKVILEPYECAGCSTLFCKSCIVHRQGKNQKPKCSKCGATRVSPLFSKDAEKKYNNLKIKCINPKCQKIVKLSDLQKHEAECLQAKCWNFQVCRTPANKEITSPKPCCSLLCETVSGLKQNFGNMNVIYEVLEKFLSKPVNLFWDAKNSGNVIKISNGGIQCSIAQIHLAYRTVLANHGFYGLKIGVATSCDFDLNSAFSDHSLGYAYYGIGQLRNDSQESGRLYGKTFLKGVVLGVCLNMNRGFLSFSLNGVYLGVAFKNEKLKKGPIYPAVALKHLAKCTIKSGLQVPSYFKD